MYVTAGQTSCRKRLEPLENELCSFHSMWMSSMPASSLPAEATGLGWDWCRRKLQLGRREVFYPWRGFGR